METTPTSIGTPCPHQLRRILIIAVVTSVLLLTLNMGVKASYRVDEETFEINVRGYSLTYYRAPEHASPPTNTLDPYDSFEKDSRGDLQIEQGGKSLFSEYTGAELRPYILKTKKGNPVVIYQASPARRWTYKTNCHGLTFLSGDYWMSNNQVGRILRDDGWVIVGQENVQRGDVVIYRESGKIVHSARVVGQDAQGHILVNSKDGYGNKLEGVWASRVCP